MTPIVDVQTDGATCRKPRRGVGSGARPRHTGAIQLVLVRRLHAKDDLRITSA